MLHVAARPRLPHLLVALALLACGCEPKPSSQTPTAAPAGPACGVQAFEQVWTRERRAALGDALAEQPGEWPAQALTNLDARVADQREAWANTYAQACTTADRPAQRCLDHQLWQLDALMTVLLDHPDRAAELWAEIDALFVQPHGCLASDEPSFDAPALALASGRALLQTRLLLNLDGGKGAELPALLDALSLDALVRETPAYALPVQASRALAAFQAGRIDEAEAALREASAAASQLGPRAQMSLAHIRAALALHRGDIQGGLLALDEGLAAARQQPDPWLLFATLRNLGRVHLQLGDPARAIEPLTEAIALSSRLASPENPQTAEIQVSLARAQLALGHVESAHDLLTQARDSFVNTLGPDHPQTLATVLATGQLLLQAGRPTDANYAFLDLMEIYTDLYGPKDVHTAAIKLEIGETLMAMEQYAGARTMYMEALTPLVQALGADHRDVIRTDIHLGYAELALGNLDEARSHCARGIDLVKALPATDPLVGEAKRCIEQLDKPARKR